MSDFAVNGDRVLELAGAVFNGDASENGVAELNSILLADEESRRRYLTYCQMHVALRVDLRARRAVQEACHQIHIDSSVPTANDSSAAGGETLPIMPVGLLSTNLPATTGFWDGMPLAYVLATVLTGIGLLIGSMIHVSGPEQVAQHPVPAVVEPQFVGRITGALDCKWASGSRVVLGQKYDLVSGVMEITYNTGAKVILQGPVRYGVELNGGYLSVGKLTGKLEKTPVGSSVASNSKPLPNPFTIHTPTATVTDLGTEFGVAVSKDGATDTHVFVGEVRIAALGGHIGAGEKSRVVRAGQFAYVGRNGPPSVDEHPSKESAKRFLRAMPSPQPSPAANAYAELVLSMKPTVYYRMEEWPKGKEVDSRVLVDSALGAHHGVLYQDRAFEPWGRGRFGGGLDLHGAAIGDYAFVPEYPKADNDRLSVSAWVRAVTVDSFASIASNWWVPAGGWSMTGADAKQIGQFFFGLDERFGLQVGLIQRDGKELRVQEGNGLPRGAWQHVAFVADGTRLHLYRNGIEVGASCSYRGITRQPSPRGLGIGGCQTDEVAVWPKAISLWSGQLDEIAVFNHALSAEQVRQLYSGPVNAARPSGRKHEAATQSAPTAEKGGGDRK